ncbi:hypothetical protein [Brevibacterium spongiae]|uniref:Uncharacterized protein n=1 Tax=Brevibacterium spongiae TaxID=2909672 RepID=A0ABY5SW05_9MICO|nr:hypothetical protein [Brevibacterium spongiae]UVI37299.1 hypothetical protein L1F31_06535 [Brevibacterium spongiae]
MSEEFVEYAGRSEPKERWLKALPLIVAGVLGVPLLAFAIMFSLQIAQVTKYIFDLGTSGWEAASFVLLSLSGAFCVIFWIAFLFIGTRRRTWRWRCWWAAAAFLAAAALPLWALLDALIHPAA